MLIDCNVAPIGEEVNSLDINNDEEQYYLDSCATCGIFMIMKRGEFMLNLTRMLITLIALGMTDVF
jgi:hypothetical protein